MFSFHLALYSSMKGKMIKMSILSDTNIRTRRIVIYRPKQIYDNLTMIYYIMIYYIIETISSI